MAPKTNEYRISFGNQSAFVWVWLRKNWMGKRNRQRFMIYTGIICLLMLFGMAPSYGQLSTGLGNYLIWFAILMLLVFAISAAVMAGVMVFILGPLLIFAWQSVSYLFGPASKRRQSVALSASGLTKHVGETSSHLEWNQIFDLVETPGTLLLFTNPNCAMIVPKYAFTSPE
ncbi:MAG: YcxB family protein [Asticcacaulis sp.]|uniref:YcxB family protein n=1 Tax=Asticcacaulis sp. TaxID=1872648 RepID=UPI0039E65B54